MPSIVPAAKLTRSELRWLGGQVIHAVDHDGQETTAVNRSIGVHDEAVDELAVPVRVRGVRRAASPNRPAA